MKHGGAFVTGITLAATILATGCGTVTSKSAPTQKKPTSPATTSSNAASGASTTNAASGSIQAGWRYVEFPSSLGGSPQIDGVRSVNGQVQLKIVTERNNGHTIQDQYMTATYQPQSNRLDSSVQTSQKPTAYQGSWHLKFSQMNGHQPVSMTLVNQSNSISIPPSIPAYASEINPPFASPGSFDNRILGQTDNWVWIAMKGPGDPPIPQLVWGYRRWNRILAVDTKTQKMQVYSVPQGTSPTNTWGTTPGFGVVSQTVYIGTGNWVGAFPADPSARSSIPVRVPEPASEIAADQAAMLKSLTTLENQAAVGIATFWNGYVMDGNQKAFNHSWIGNPAIFNHGDYPTQLYWALNFPLQTGSQAEAERTKLVSDIQEMLKSPLMQAWIVYPDPASMKAHFHSTPPTPVPGYHIVNGYYVKN